MHLLRVLVHPARRGLIICGRMLCSGACSLWFGSDAWTDGISDYTT
jgi:hypothetical protein